ncbi:hypothetical protein VTJ83DRAFT_2401 [Remersonia thermophila]|uniref:Integral membrane protein n=1 Tax=Remersonia thermophila TaxID=72144 RepID=A0ABR4DIQ0_9PEZI
MASFGRFVCVLVPFCLTLASLVAMLVGGLSGVLDKSLYNFSLNLTDLSISPNMVSSIISGEVFNNNKRDGARNLTAADLGLYNVYDINPWNYCYTKQDGQRECIPAAYDWAAEALNNTTNNWNNILTSTGMNVTLPEEITDAVRAFGSVSRWTQISFMVAWVALGVELFFGLLANCSRAFSCATFLIALVAGLAVGAAAGLATATAAIVVGAVEATQTVAGLDAHMNTRFLATVWLGVLFAAGAALFWMFTICCCAPDRRSHSRSRDTAGGEKYALGGLAGPATPSYQRLSDPNGFNNNDYSSAYGQQYPRADYDAPQSYHGGAYEPYSHRA